MGGWQVAGDGPGAVVVPDGFIQGVWRGCGDQFPGVGAAGEAGGAVPAEVVGLVPVLTPTPGGHDIPAAINSPGYRQGPGLSSGLTVQMEGVLTCRWLPGPSLPDGDPLALIRSRLMSLDTREKSLQRRAGERE